MYTEQNQLHVLDTGIMGRTNLAGDLEEGLEAEIWKSWRGYEYSFTSLEEEVGVPDDMTGEYV